MVIYVRLTTEEKNGGGLLFLSSLFGAWIVGDYGHSKVYLSFL